MKTQVLNDPEKCKQLIDAYRKHDYYCAMAEVAINKINNLTLKMSWDDIKYCIERTSK